MNYLITGVCRKLDGGWVVSVRVFLHCVTFRVRKDVVTLVLLRILRHKINSKEMKETEHAINYYIIIIIMLRHL